jgi:hypothetical protein
MSVELIELLKEDDGPSTVGERKSTSNYLQLRHLLQHILAFDQRYGDVDTLRRAALRSGPGFGAGGLHR